MPETTYCFLNFHGGITWWFEDHDRPIDVHDRNCRNGAQLGPQRLGLSCDHITMSVRVSCMGEVGSAQSSITGIMKRTDDAK